MTEQATSYVPLVSTSETMLDIVQTVINVFNRYRDEMHHSMDIDTVEAKWLPILVGFVPDDGRLFTMILGPSIARKLLKKIYQMDDKRGTAASINMLSEILDLLWDYTVIRDSNDIPIKIKIYVESKDVPGLTPEEIRAYHEEAYNALLPLLHGNNEFFTMSVASGRYYQYAVMDGFTTNFLDEDIV